MDVARLGAAFRAVRLRRRLRQRDVAIQARVSTSTVSRVERGHVGTLAVDTLAGLAAVLEIRLDIVARWRGGDLDRMLRAGHGRMHEQMAQLIGRLRGWTSEHEVTFSIYGERGVIDILAFHAARRLLLVVELKTEVVDLQELLSAVDRYRRIAPAVAARRGWRAAGVASVVVIRDSSTNRRRVAAHARVLRSAFPDDGRSFRSWLRDPSRPLSALTFLSDSHPGTPGEHSGSVKRVRPR